VPRNECLLGPSIVAATATGKIARVMKSVFLVALGVMNGGAMTAAARLSLDSSRHRWSLARASIVIRNCQHNCRTDATRDCQNLSDKYQNRVLYGTDLEY